MTTQDKAALDFKSATLYTLRVVLHSSDSAALATDLARRMADAGSFYEDEAVVIDAEGLTEPLDWAKVIHMLRQHSLHPVGVVAAGANLAAAQQAGLAAVDLSAPVTRPPSTPADARDVPPVTGSDARDDRDARSAKGATRGGGGSSSGSRRTAGSAETRKQAAGMAEAPAELAPAALVINRPLRSGQRVYARNTDLIVIGMVSQGAEVIADGNIHVYGPLRGKAMAGARGDASARIFTTRFDPELIAIAGVYRVIETQLDSRLHNLPVLTQRDGDALDIRPLID